MRSSRLIPYAVVAFLGLCPLATVSAQPPEDHPFALVNIVDLYDLFALDPNVVDTGFSTSSPPPNWNLYLASPRIGSQPASVAVDGSRMWIGGFWNGPTYSGGALEAGWYASLGVAEARDILTISGYGAPYIRYADPNHVIAGPMVGSTDSYTGLDYDPFLSRLYATYDDTLDISFFGYPSGAPTQLGSMITAYDADPNSPGYAGSLWTFEDPLFPSTGPFDPGDDRYRGGIVADPFDGLSIVVPRPGVDGPFMRIDALNPVIDPNDPFLFFNAKDQDIQANECPSSWFRSAVVDPITGDLVMRNSNAVTRVARDPRSIGGPFETISRFIQEPGAGGNGTVDTTPTGDDVYVDGLGFGDPVDAGDNIIAAGLNGLIDTVPAGDDELSGSEIVASRLVGNYANGIGDDCNDDPNDGFPNGPFAQGQGIAYVSSANIPGLDVDLVIANNRESFGSGWPKDVRIYTADGEYFGQLELPCSPPADDGDPQTTEGIAIYDIDYDEATGTLVVLQFEEHRAYVFKANIENSDLAYSRYDWDRNSRTDLRDFLQFQRCFTGFENTDGLSLSCQRMNTDSDCDIDVDDYLVFEAYFDAAGGP
ncbi:MAG: hypothetical protein JXO22_04620 [Phycisphaerae bacterium]|nr:hypothetical protein [Phycisphaerae bacterium]